MRYSRFNEQRGLYEVFEDDREHAMNGDLPVPKLPPANNKIGVSARHAGRALPSSAKRVGQSFHPVGVVVTSVPPGGSFSGFQDEVRKRPYLFAAGTAVLCFGLMHVYISSMQSWWRR